MNLTVANKGQKAQALYSATQYAFDNSHRKFPVSVEAEVVAQQASALFDFIKPGHALTGDLYFDIPARDSIHKLELHDTTTKLGVTILNQRHN